jgi:hypothetical protein
LIFSIFICILLAKCEWSAKRSITDSLFLPTALTGARRANTIEAGVGCHTLAQGCPIADITKVSVPVPNCYVGSSNKYFVLDLVSEVKTVCTVSYSPIFQT